jgi:hypothetical protein
LVDGRAPARGNKFGNVLCQALGDRITQPAGLMQVKGPSSILAELVDSLLEELLEVFSAEGEASVGPRLEGLLHVSRQVGRCRQ